MGSPDARPAALRVAIVEAYPQVLGGAHVVHAEIARRGRESGSWHTTVFLPQEGPAAEWLRARSAVVAVVAAPGALLQFGGAWRSGVGRALLALPGYWRRLARELRGHDVVHLSDLRGVILGLPAALLSRRPVVVHVHSAERGQRLWRVISRLLLRGGVPLVVPSRQGAATWLRPGDPCVVLGNPVEPRPVAQEAARPTLTCVARLHPDKGLDVLLDALEQLGAGGRALTTFLVGPSSPGHDSLARELADRAARIPGVQLVGLVDDPGPYLQQSWVYVQPSRHESFGLAALEASASGLPVVASRAGGLTEVVLDEETGLLVEPGDAAGLAQAIARLLDDEELRRRMGRAGRRHATTAYGPDQFERVLLELYQGVLR